MVRYGSSGLLIKIALKYHRKVLRVTKFFSFCRDDFKCFKEPLLRVFHLFGLGTICCRGCSQITNTIYNLVVDRFDVQSR